MFNNNKDFDADLAKGQRNEKRICDILGLGKEKIEIKLNITSGRSLKDVALNWRVMENLLVSEQQKQNIGYMLSMKVKH